MKLKLIVKLNESRITGIIASLTIIANKPLLHDVKQIDNKTSKISM